MNRELLKLYAIAGDDTSYGAIEGALRGGVTILQLRVKNLPLDDYIRKAKEVKAITSSYGVPLIINDRLDAALEAGADGVHLGLEDMPVAEARRKAGSGFIIGATAKTCQRAREAELEGADYLGSGALFASPTKRDAIRIDKEMFGRIAGSVSIPVIGIGGITEENIVTLSGCPAAGFALSSAIFSAPDPEEASKRLLRLIEGILKEE